MGFFRGIRSIEGKIRFIKIIDNENSFFVQANHKFILLHIYTNQFHKYFFLKVGGI